MTHKPIDPFVTRFPSPIKENSFSREEKIAHIAHHFREIMTILGLDVADDSLAKTPLRVAKMYVDEVFTGLDPNNFPEVQLFEEDLVCLEGESGFVVSQCSFYSFCEHHFVPMSGKAYVAYIPTGKLIGLSKLHRLVRFFAARPQLQERLGAQVGDALSHIVNSKDIAVSIEAEHSCVHIRGVKDQMGKTITNYFSGAFKTDATKREEFLRSISRCHT